MKICALVEMQLYGNFQISILNNKRKKIDRQSPLKSDFDLFQLYFDLSQFKDKKAQYRLFFIFEFLCFFCSVGLVKGLPILCRPPFSVEKEINRCGLST